MRAIILALLLVTGPTTWAGQLSPAMDQLGDFIVIDAKGEVQLVGRFEMDLTVFSRAYADGNKKRGNAPFTIGQYRGGQIVAARKGTMEYSITDNRIVFSFSPNMEDAGLTFLIRFDPSEEVSFGPASQGNIAGPKTVGTAHVRFRK